MARLRSLLLSFRAIDLLVVVFTIFLTILNIIFHERVEYWDNLVLANVLLILFVFILAYMNKNNGNIFWQQLHFWYIVPLIFLSFKELYLMVRPIRQVDLDNVLIEVDRFLFGMDPTVALQSISNPFLTELLQIVYATFFFLPIILAIDLLLNDRMKEFDFESFAILYGFFLSYIGYFMVPAIGPRFTIHDFSATNLELPGIFLTNFLREIVNAGESISQGTLNPIDIVQRDVFPSGHTQMTLIVMFLSVKFRTITRYFFLPVGSLLIFSTVYLRYHYVIDLIAGLLFMMFTMWSGYYLYNKWMNIKGEEKFEYPKY